MLLQAVLWMNCALLFYTWAVFTARSAGLQKKHLLLFGIGLLCDYIGTDRMLSYGLSAGVIPEWHIVIGFASLSGMAFHFLLACAAAVTSHSGAINRLFHRISLNIYIGWLIAFITGSVAGMSGR